MAIICHIFSISGYGIYPGTALWLERFAKGRPSKALSANDGPYCKRWDVGQSSSIASTGTVQRNSFPNSVVVPDRLVIPIESDEDIMKLKLAS
jgi:hypothetical protein